MNPHLLFSVAGVLNLRSRKTSPPPPKDLRIGFRGSVNLKHGRAYSYFFIFP